MAALRTPGGSWCCRAVLGRVMVAALAGLLTSGACSDDGFSDSNGGGSGNPATTVGEAAGVATSTTQPSAVEDEGAAFDAVEALVAESSEVTDRLFERPSLVLDTGSRDLARLTELYTPDSPGLETLLGELEDLAAEDHRLQPGPSGVFSREVIWDLTAEGGDTISFETCAVFDTETVDSEGEVVDSGTLATMGTGEAHRVDGVWRYHGVDASGEGPGEIEPNEVADVVRFCEALADGGGS